MTWKKKRGSEYWSANGRYAIVRESGKRKVPGWYVYERIPRKKRRLLGGPYSFRLAKFAADLLILQRELKAKEADKDGQEKQDSLG